MEGKSALQMFNIEVEFQRREDGGLRARCEAVPGFCLSHSDPQTVISDVPAVLGTILTGMLGKHVVVSKLPDIAEALGLNDAPELPAYICNQNYIGRHSAK